MAYRAGAVLADMAIVQFHPTTLYVAGASRSLISEAVRGAGAHLLDQGGRRFMPAVHDMAELAPRDIVARAIMRQMASQGGANVWLDARHVKHANARFPGIAAVLKRFDLDLEHDLIPVHPAAHYMIGGVRTDLAGRTSVPGLYAAGEAACTGLHGANRLASNSLLEGLVFGECAGRVCAEMKSASAAAAVSVPRPSAWGQSPWMTAQSAPMAIVSDIRPSDRGELDLSDVRSSLRSAMWKNVGLERAGQKLEGVVEMIDFWARYTLDKIFDDPAGWETQNMLLSAWLAARSALWREESRGCHVRAEWPGPRAEFAVHDLWRRGWSEPRTEPAATPMATSAQAAGGAIP
jgi:L-aspartate oxidase